MAGTEPTAPDSLLSRPLDSQTGVGSKVSLKLKKLGITTLEDALYHLPLRYEDRRKLSKISHLSENTQEIFLCKVLATGEGQTKRTARRLFEVVVGDETGTISLKWFHYRKAWLQKRFPVGQQLLVIGEVKRFGAIREIHHPDTEIITESLRLEELQQKDPLIFGRILPVYPLTEGISQKQMRKIWYPLIQQSARLLPTVLPAEIRDHYRLLPPGTAIRQVHWPDAETTDLRELEKGTDPARRTLVFDDFFYLELGLALKRAGVELETGQSFPCRHKYTLPLSKMLPFKLTQAQRRVLGEIKQDMHQPHPMHRLLQGDVGSGKTIVALMAALIAIENQAQVAVVAPTEILAEQHYATFAPWLERLGLSCCLLSGSTPAAEKSRLYTDIANGKYDLVCGTHAVLQDGVTFRQLGLGIIDEQHRFGVRQRSLLKHKGISPDILVMTATPIPRTLSMTLYGDLSVSVIDELPPGRKPVTTKVYSEANKKQVQTLMRREIDKGRQVYVVYPLVEESENSDLKAATAAAEHYAHDIFPDIRVGLVHGKLKGAEKDRVMTAFRTGDIQLLVATTVIEVGVDVPNASVMVIEHADRFGLSQLHQLRGRVGRGADQSYCMLVASDNYSKDAAKRLQVMASTQDGFKIAEADLAIRGPGDFLGTRQAGLPDFRVASLAKDISVLEQARQAAFTYVEQTDRLTSPDAAPVKEELIKRWGSRLELASIG